MTDTQWARTLMDGDAEHALSIIKERDRQAIAIASLTEQLREERQWHAEKTRRVLELEGLVADYREAHADKKRLTRELDVALNGEDGAAPQASLGDLVSPARALRRSEQRLAEATHRLLVAVSDVLSRKSPDDLLMQQWQALNEAAGAAKDVLQGRS